ncbi:MAG TPA: hypothetical protein GX507_07925 [Clostridia bacterium]|nr:hypothetical protein [Clostridia bacterium]
MDLAPVFEIQIVGEGIYPESIPIKNLVDILTSVNDAISELVEQKLQRSKDTSFLLGLKAITRSKSAVYEFTSNRPDLAEDAVNTIASALVDNRLTDLPPGTQEGLYKLADFALARGARVNFAKPSGEILACIDESTVISFKTPMASGETVIYGRVIRVGGVEPKIRLILDDGSQVTCTATEDQAKQVARRLYETVGLKGFAEWDTDNWSLKAFSVGEILDYVETPITLAFKELAEAAGPEAWSDVVDIVEAIRCLREECYEDDSLP